MFETVVLVVSGILFLVSIVLAYITWRLHKQNEYAGGHRSDYQETSLEELFDYQTEK